MVELSVWEATPVQFCTMRALQKAAEVIKKGFFVALVQGWPS